ncbi:hypothetical protein O1L60_23510 [Streptomyces diastatochromogenes]|nr:hypothetical protein [Streptomyces diastatochromogenes]
MPTQRVAREELDAAPDEPRAADGTGTEVLAGGPPKTTAQWPQPPSSPSRPRTPGAFLAAPHPRPSAPAPSPVAAGAPPCSPRCSPGSSRAAPSSPP